MSPDEIARQFREALNRGEFLDPMAYYAVQRECLSALAQSKSTVRVTLFCAAALAEALAKALEGGGIGAQAEGNWRACADALEQTVRLAGYNPSAQEILWKLASAISTIYPTEGAL